jgi:Arc/MetJ family transcription regulator
MRTNIDLDDDLVQEAMRYSKARSKRALVEEALRAFVDVRTQEIRRSNYQNRLASIRSRTSSIRLKKSAVEILHEDRSRA